MEYSKERSEDLMRAYDEYIASCKFIKMADVYTHIVDMPSKRFWVSDIRAALVVSAMMRGAIKFDSMCPTRKEMYQEIYKRVIKLRMIHPRKTILELTSMVVTQPAPKFYLASGSAKIMVCKARKEWMRRKRQKLQHLLSQQQS